MLLDSNVIIYSVDPSQSALRAFIAAQSPAVSVISYVEVLGYHALAPADRTAFEQFFRSADVIPIDQAVVDQAVALRQQRRMSLGDSLIAGTAIAHRRTLVTRNTADFRWIAGLTLLDPTTLTGAGP